MRVVGGILAFALFLFYALAVTGGCKSACTSASDVTQSVDLAVATGAIADSGTPLCSACMGPVQTPYYECQSTCGTMTAIEDNDAGEAGAPFSSSCVVDSCATTVKASLNSCNAACATLFPGKDVTECSFNDGGTFVSCTIHEDGTCG